MINTIDSNGKSKIHATTHDITTTQKVDGSTLYDALELSFNTIDKTAILKTNNIDVLAPLALKASASTVYTKQEINDVYIAFANSLNTKADKTTTCLKTDVDVLLYILQAGINNRILTKSVDVNGKFKTHATTNDILNTQKVDGSTLYDSLELSFNTVDKTSILKLNNINMLASVASKFSYNNVYTKQEIT